MSFKTRLFWSQHYKKKLSGIRFCPKLKLKRRKANQPKVVTPENISLQTSYGRVVSFFVRPKKCFVIPKELYILIRKKHKNKKKRKITESEKKLAKSDFFYATRYYYKVNKIRNEKLINLTNINVTDYSTIFTGDIDDEFPISLKDINYIKTNAVKFKFYYLSRSL